MHMRWKRTAGLWMLALAAAATGCEDSGVPAPADASLVLSANPETVVIDTDRGQAVGTSTIIAQLFDDSGFALQGVDVIFTTTGGTLGSAESSPGATAPVKTDASGIAVDLLTLGLADPTTVDVTARASSLSATVTVTKTIRSGNAQPVAAIVVNPSTRQQAGRPVSFNGQGSSDPDGQITCFQWAVTSSVGASNEVVQGPRTSVLTRTYSEPQQLQVELRVSDEPSAGFCDECAGAPSSCGAALSNFSPITASLIPPYEIVCDLTPPTAEAGPDVPATLVGASVSVVLDAGGSFDNDSGIAAYAWSCGNGTAIQSGRQATCTYRAVRSYTAEVTVTNGCGDRSSDTTMVNVSGP